MKPRLKRAAGILTAAVIALSTAVSTAISGSAASKFSGSYFGSGFDSYEWGVMEASDGWSNGGMFNCTWSKGNVNFSGGIMNLSITGNSWQGFKGAEYRTVQTFGYGMYDVSMKPIKQEGVVSSFFTYTGPSDGTVWDEIDIEFLGKDTTKVQFNYYTNGRGNHEYVYDLGFDASKEFHQYGFYWSENSITWYVDTKPVYTAYVDIPSTPGKIMMNAWNGTGVDDWLGHYNGTVPLTAQYDWISYTAPSSASSGSSNNSNSSSSNSSNSSYSDFNPNQKYVIKSVNSGKALDVAWGSKDDGANVLQYSYYGYENQKWYLEKQSNGYYVIKSANSGKVLDVAWGSTADGANVQQCRYYGNSCQQWELRKVGSSYAIISVNSGKALDVEAKSKADNANVLQWRYTGATNQLWTIEAVY